jgi:hypothetical protein
VNLDQTGIDEAVAGVRKELAALRVTLEAIGEARGETRRRATAFEAETVARLDTFEARVEEICSVVDAKIAETDRREEMLRRLESVEGTVSRLEAETAEARQFVRSVRSLRLLRLRRRILQRLHG